MTLTEMRRFLIDGDIQLTKSLGQNFLHDGNQLRRIVDVAELQSTDRVLEVGPGLGPLTELLVERAGEVLAIEKDKRLVDFLAARFAVALSSRRGESGTPALSLLHDDALEFLRREQRNWSDWKLVANLPYSVASPILVELAQAIQAPKLMVATLQLEVAQRLVAPPGSRDYGVLTLLVQLRYETRGHFKIPAACFFPKPDVDSACVTLVRRSTPLLAEILVPVFTRLVKLGFSQRRKMMLKLLKDEWPEEKLRMAFEQLGLSTQARAETVSVEQFVRLTRTLSST